MQKLQLYLQFQLKPRELVENYHHGQGRENFYHHHNTHKLTKRSRVWVIPSGEVEITSTYKNHGKKR